MLCYISLSLLCLDLLVSPLVLGCTPDPRFTPATTPSTNSGGSRGSTGSGGSGPTTRCPDTAVDLSDGTCIAAFAGSADIKYSDAAGLCTSNSGTIAQLCTSADLTAANQAMAKKSMGTAFIGHKKSGSTCDVTYSAGGTGKEFYIDSGDNKVTDGNASVTTTNGVLCIVPKS